MRQEATNSRSWLPLAMVGAALLTLYLLWNVLLIFIISGLVAFVLYPIVQFLERRAGMRRIYAIISVYLLLLIFLTLLIGLLAPVVDQQFSQLTKSAPSFIERARDIITSAQTRYIHVPERWRGVADKALTELQQTVIRVAREVVPAIVGLFTSLFGLVFVPLLAFFLLLDSQGYKQMILAVTPPRGKQTVENLLYCLGRSVWDFIRGQLILMAIVGTAIGVGLYIVGFPYPAVFGILAGLLEVIPSFGPLLTTTMVAFVGLVTEPTLALKGAAVTVSVQILENLFLVPVVMAKTVGLNPLTVAFSVFVGGTAAGVLGAVIAIPIAVAVKIVILYFYVNETDLPGKRQAVCELPQPQRARRRTRPPRRGRR